LVLHVSGIFIDAVDRTHFHALGFVMMAYAFGAQFRIDDINVFALGDSAIGAFRLADITVDAFIINNKGHKNS
jgi:hypothetical protein